MRTFKILFLFTMAFFVQNSYVLPQSKEDPETLKTGTGTFLTGPDFLEIYVSPSGNDKWSGRIPKPAPDQMDGPVASIQKALELIRFFKGEPYNRTLPQYITPPGRLSDGFMQGPAIIWLRGGNYFIDKAIEIGLAESYPITFMAYPGETPVLNGGVVINNWKVTKVNGVKAWSTTIKEVADGSWNFSQLFVNDMRAQRARYPKSGFFRVEDPLIPTDREVNPHSYAGNEFIAAPGDIKPWKGIDNGEVVILHFWIEERLPIKSFNPKTRLLTTSKMTKKVLLDAHPAHSPGNARYYVENVFETLTDPGEWYLDRPSGTLYYIPKPGETPESTIIFAPKTIKFFNIAGDAEKERYVENIHFRGITFQNTKIDNEAHERSIIGGPEKPESSVIYLNAANYCSFEDCTFKHIGETAIVVDGNSTGIRIVGNVFDDMAGAGVVFLGRPTDGNLAPSTSSILVSDNYFKSGGRVFHGASAMVISYVLNTTVTHNSIQDYYWSGMNIHGNIANSLVIEKNHIFDIGQGWLSDLGGIYTQGYQPGIEIRGNKIHDINCSVYGGNCIYLDDWSGFAVVEFNLCYNANTDLINIKGSENIVRNNILAFGSQGCMRRASALTNGGRFVANVERNILVARGNPIYRTGYYMDIYDPVWNSDQNLIWDVSKKPLVCVQQASGPEDIKISFDQWVNIRGNDSHSIISDPLFKDAENLNFSLDENSPAFELGFENFDLSNVGPRPKEVWQKALKEGGKMIVTKPVAD